MTHLKTELDAVPCAMSSKPAKIPATHFIIAITPAPSRISAMRPHGERFLVLRVVISLSWAAIAESFAAIVSFFAATVNFNASDSARRVPFSSVSNSFARFSVSSRERNAAFSVSSASISIRDLRSSSAAALHAERIDVFCFGGPLIADG